MFNWLFVVFAALAGGCVAVQGAVNARMASALHIPVASALLNFLVGTVVLMALVFSGAFGRVQWSGLAVAPWWAYLGGLFGALFVTSVILSVPKVGTAATFSAVLCGQLVVASLLDSYGWLGVDPTPLTPLRGIGVGLLIVGVLLVELG